MELVLANAIHIRTSPAARPKSATLTAAYYMLREGVDYRDLGTDHFDHIDKSKTTNRLVRRLKDRGYEVELKAVA